jgi:hypothetical protein
VTRRYTEVAARKLNGGGNIADEVQMDDGRVLTMREFWAEPPTHFPAAKKWIPPQARAPNQNLTRGGRQTAAKIRAQFGNRPGTVAAIIDAVMSGFEVVQDVSVDDTNPHKPGTVEILCVVPARDREPGLDERISAHLEDTRPVGVVYEVKVVPPLGEAPEPPPEPPKPPRSLQRRPATDWWADKSKPVKPPPGSVSINGKMVGTITEWSITCGSCNGTGKITYVEGPGANDTLTGACSICHGSGKVPGRPKKPTCPWCSSTNLDAEFVDNGVGQQQVTPYLCGDCGSSEFYPDDHDSDKPTAGEKKRGWWMGPPEQMSVEAATAFIQEEVKERLESVLGKSVEESREIIKENLKKTLEKLQADGSPILDATLDGEELIVRMPGPRMISQTFILEDTKVEIE